MRRISTTLFLFVLSFPLAEISRGEGKFQCPVDQAVKIVQKPARGFGNMSPFELQVYYRLRTLLDQHEYTFAKSDASTWKGLLIDEKANMYGRLCAAYFLIDDDEEARKFLQQQIRSENLRYRYNAAEVLQESVKCDAAKHWAIDQIISLLADGRS